MIKSKLLQPVRVVQAENASSEEKSARYTVSVVDGEPVALNDSAALLTMQLTDPELDLPRLVQAAEALLPAHRETPGVVALNEDGEVLGVVAREDLEEAVLLRRRHEYAELPQVLGLGRGYSEPAGHPVAPFIYWACPKCDHIRIPAAGHVNDTPPLCRRHDPPVQMERRTHPGH